MDPVSGRFLNPFGVEVCGLDRDLVEFRDDGVAGFNKIAENGWSRLRKPVAAGCLRRRWAHREGRSAYRRKWENETGHRPEP
jgi:hypothetical protein